MTRGIAIVGMACIYPDARTPGELWRNILAQRRAFRRIPRERLRLEDYHSTDRTLPDTFYSTEAALIADYEFDRLGFKVVGSTFRAADMAHWLALDVASMALADAGFPDADGLPLEETAVILGNTLTGEFSRANVLRLRWPYVRRVVQAELRKRGWTDEQCRELLADLETEYKSPFPEPGEETLAGGLSNTIAGRVCNHFDLKGGGYTVDGACAASLLAVTNACSALLDGDVSVALAGGVDLSLDPFELVGFARTGALAPELMRVYDARSAGFWPGEGCGFVVLMREEDALAQNRRVYAVIRGWGVSSDGSGGITRPEVAGQKIALRRAYRRAGFGPDRVGYFEGHGTGTAVGDATELRVLSEALREADAEAPAVIGSIKANIGHTKAAAGIAGLIKATLALHERVLPPTTGCITPHAELGGPRPALRVLRSAEPWTDSAARFAGVSAMGFGGINTHVVLEGAEASSAVGSIPNYRTQDAELFVFAAPDSAALREALEPLRARAAGLSRAEMADVAALLAADDLAGEIRAAIVASSPAQFADRIEKLIEHLDRGVEVGLNAADDVFLAKSRSKPRIGFLFPGQGSPSHLSGGAMRERFEFANQLYRLANLNVDADAVSTAIAQPAIATACAAALAMLAEFGIEAEAAVGHSLGELTALHWAGVVTDVALIELARARGRAMSELGSPTGAMAGLRADEQTVASIIGETAEEESRTALARDGGGSPLDELVIAGLNSPRQTVISGPADAVDRVVAKAVSHGVAATRLPVSHAFHSPLVAAAAPALRAHIDAMTLSPIARRVISTITGDELAPQADVNDLLCRQLTSPVRFIEAARKAFAGFDLLIEIGPGDVLTGLAADSVGVPVVPTDAGGPSLAPLLGALGASWTLGVDVRHELLYRDRLTRPIDLARRPGFFVNPCELAPVSDGEDADWLRESAARMAATAEAALADGAVLQSGADAGPLELVQRLVAERAELPAESVSPDHRLLNDLHLNSISVGQIVADAARIMGLPNPVSPTAYANATVAELGNALDDWARQAKRGDVKTALPRTAAGVDAWIQPLATRWIEQSLSPRTPAHVSGGWRVIAPPEHPMVESLGRSLSRSAPGGGVALCVPVNPGETDIPLLLNAARAALSDESARFLVVQQGGGAAALARTLHLERPAIDTAVVDVLFDHPRAAEWAAAEAAAVSGYSEASYDSDGVRRVPVLAPVMLDSPGGAMPLGAEDVVLITGGGKGIAAECAIHIARQTGAAVAILGRSDPADDAELTSTLSRLADGGARCRYVRADVCNSDAIARAVSEVQHALGPVTAVIHAAGLNNPKLLDALSAEDFARTVRPKISGLKNVLAAVEPDRLRLLVSFGSIIADAGMPGQTDYAVANDWLARMTEQWHASHGHCRCLAIDWSVWQSVGMGKRLGRIEALMQQGVTPIPTDEGLAQMHRLLCSTDAPSRVIVAGRFGSPPTLGARRGSLPLWRFIERPIVDYPGIELVVDAEVSAVTDPYVREHALHGECLFPAVMGIEGMSQAAAALLGERAPRSIRDIAFHRPIVVPATGPITIRFCALARALRTVEVVLRCSATDFQVDYFRATFEFDAPADRETPAPLEIYLGGNGRGHIPLDRESDLYGDLLFHNGRFRRVAGYRGLMARRCLAEFTSPAREDWFAPYLPGAFLLGDPAARDAAIHAIQSCIPHARLLPVSVECIERHASEDVVAHAMRAVETSREGDTFTYDMQMLDADERVIEVWRGLRLTVLEPIAHARGWNAALLANYVERRAGELLGGAALCVVLEEAVSPDRRTRGDHAIDMALGGAAPPARRSDGKPEPVNGRHVSAAHADQLTLAIASSSRAACDLEPVAQRDSAAWTALLGEPGFSLARVVSEQRGESLDLAATRVWCAIECLRKADVPPGGPLVFDDATHDGWLILRAGGLRAATYAADIHGQPRTAVIAVLAGDAR